MLFMCIFLVKRLDCELVKSRIPLHKVLGRLKAIRQRSSYLHIQNGLRTQNSLNLSSRVTSCLGGCGSPPMGWSTRVPWAHRSFIKLNDSVLQLRFGHQQLLTEDLDTSGVFMMTLARFSWAAGGPEGPGGRGGEGKGLLRMSQDVPPEKGAESRTVVILKLGLSGEMKEDMPGRGFLSSSPNSAAWTRCGNTSTVSDHATTLQYSD